jgi:DNA modification methylase
MIYDIKDIPEHLQKYFEPVPQIGLESTPQEFVAKLVEVFTEVRRVLKSDGTCWLNLGDSYSGAANSGGTNGNDGGPAVRIKGMPPKPGKPKDLLGIPWRVAFALQESGWWLRQDIIWAKPNPMPESVTDRCTKAHEYIFLLTKSARYYYDSEAIKESID